jgi:hypothetical protein
MIKETEQYQIIRQWKHFEICGVQIRVFSMKLVGLNIHNRIKDKLKI